MRLGLAAGVAFLAPLLLVMGLSWPLALHLGHWHMVTAWGDSHIWVMEWTLRHLLDGRPQALLQPTLEAGFPVARDLRSVGGAALLIYSPLRLLLSPLAAGTLTHLLVLPATSLLTHGALGALTRASPWTRAALASAYAVGPTVLSTLGMGEISNTQAWVLPAFLWAAHSMLPLDRSTVRLKRAPLVALVGLLGGLSSPYLGLALPLVAAGWVLAARRLLPGGVLLLALFLGLLPVGAWFGGSGSGRDSLVAPAPRALHEAPRGQALPQPPPVATPDSLLLGTAQGPRSPYEPTHVSYLGLPLLLAALLVGRKERLGLALFIGGVVLSLGPWLAVSGRYIQVLGGAFSLPVRLIELLGYPTRQGGLYFRYAILAELGLVLMLATGLAGRRYGALFAWGLAIVHGADSVRDTMPRWPLRVEPVAGIEALRAMAGEAPGAVLELPLQGPTDGHFGQAGVLRALFHKRPTSSLLRDVRPHEDAAREVLNKARLEPDRLGERLREAGFAYVVLPAELARFSVPDEAVLRRLLGEPWAEEGGLMVWKLE